MVEAVWHGVFMEFLAGLLMAVSSCNNMHLIIHLLLEYLMISYQVSITEPFSWLTMTAQSTFTHPFAFTLTDQRAFKHWVGFWLVLQLRS